MKKHFVSTSRIFHDSGLLQVSYARTYELEHVVTIVMNRWSVLGQKSKKEPDSRETQKMRKGEKNLFVVDWVHKKVFKVGSNKGRLVSIKHV